MERLKNDIFFSIIIPVYNAESMINNAILSVINQSYANWELLIIDDCSIDNTRDVVLSFTINNSKIKYFCLEKNSGNAKVPRDFGVSVSSGDYCVMLDSDDELSNDYLMCIQEKILNESADVIISTMHIRDLITRKILNILPSNQLHIPINGKEACRLILSSWKFSGNGIAFTKKLYKYVMLFNPYKYCFSDEMSERILVYYANKVGLSSGVYTYWQHSSSITNRCTPKLFEKLDVNLNLLDFTKERYQQIDIDSVCEMALIDLIVLYKLYLKHHNEFTIDVDMQIQNKFKLSFEYLLKIDWKKNWRNRVYMFNFSTFKFISKLFYYLRK